MTYPQGYPQEVSEDEHDAGFRRYELEGFEGNTEDLVVVVARILSKYDVLLKIHSGYAGNCFSHYRRGYSNWIVKDPDPSWCLLSTGHDLQSASIIIQEYDFVGSDDAYPNEIIKVQFKWREM